MDKQGEGALRGTTPDPESLQALREQYPFLYTKFVKRELAKELEDKDIFGIQ